jgi:hypothetical protein
MIKNIAIALLFFCNAIFAFKYYHCLNGIPYISQVTLPGDTVEIVRYRDSSGISHIITDPAFREVIHREALNQSSPLRPYLDTIARALSIKSDQVEQVTILSTRMKEDNTVLKEQVAQLKDSIRNYTFNDKWLKAILKVPGTQNPGIDSATLDMTYDADLNIKQYSKRKRLLGLPIGELQSFTDIGSNDPRTTIKNRKVFTFKQVQPIYGLRGQIRASFTPSTSSLSIGPALRFDVQNISIGATLYYNFTDNRFRPNLTADYTVF